MQRKLDKFSILKRIQLLFFRSRNRSHKNMIEKSMWELKKKLIWSWKKVLNELKNILYDSKRNKMKSFASEGPCKT